MKVTEKRISTALGLLLLAIVPASARAQALSANQATANSVATVLRQDAGLSASKIAIDAREGLVTLSGVVPSAELKMEAVRRTQAVAGVNSVVDHLAVGDPKIIPARFQPAMQPTRVAMGGHGHAGGYAGAPVAGGAVEGGFVGGDLADLSGPMPEGAAVPGATQAASPGLPNYAWPSYAPHPNFSAVGYPTAYPWQAWPNIGPFYPYPEVPLDWRAVTLRWDDGIWWLDFRKHYTRPFFTPYPFGLFAY